MEPAESKHRGRIVVGTDGSPASSVAVRWAVEAASLVDARLDVVLVWSPAIDFGWLGASPGHGWLPEPATDRRSLVWTLLARVCAGHVPDFVRVVVLEGDPAQSLVAHAEGADLLVLGDRGTGGFLGLSVGSTASTCTRRATCPVLIVPADSCPDPRVAVVQESRSEAVPDVSVR